MWGEGATGSPQTLTLEEEGLILSSALSVLVCKPCPYFKLTFLRIRITIPSLQHCLTIKWGGEESSSKVPSTLPTTK